MFLFFVYLDWFYFYKVNTYFFNLSALYPETLKSHRMHLTKYTHTHHIHSHNTPKKPSTHTPHTFLRVKNKDIRKIGSKFMPCRKQLSLASCIISLSYTRTHTHTLSLSLSYKPTHTLSLRHSYTLFLALYSILLAQLPTYFIQTLWSQWHFLAHPVKSTNSTSLHGWWLFEFEQFNWGGSSSLHWNIKIFMFGLSDEILAR